MPAAVSYWRTGKRSGGSLLPTQGTARPAPAVPSVMHPRIPQAGMGAGRAPHQSSWGDTPHRLPLPQLSPPRAGRGPRDTKTMLCWGAGSREDSGAVATSVTPTGHGAQPAAEERGQRYRQMTTFIPHHVLRYWYIELPTELPKSTSPASPLPKIPTERSLQTELGLLMPSRWWLVSHLDDSIRDQLNLAIGDFVQVPRSYSVCVQIFQQTSKPSKSTCGKSLVCFWLSTEEHKPPWLVGAVLTGGPPTAASRKVPRDVSLKGRQLTPPPHRRTWGPRHLTDRHGGWLGLQRASPPKSALPQSCVLGAGHGWAEQQGGDWPTATSFSHGMGAARAVPGASGMMTHFQGRKIRHRGRTEIKSPWKRKTFISSLSVLHPLESCPAVKRENHCYIEHNFIAHFCFWWKLIRGGFFCTSIYACAQGTERFPLTKWNIVPASRQTLWILAISTFQQRSPRLWIYLSAAFGFFLRQLREGERCCSSAAICHCFDWKSRFILGPRRWPVSITDTSRGSLALWAQVNFATFSSVLGVYWRNGACPCPGFQLVDDAAGCKSYSYSADGFLCRRLQRAFLSSELHEPAIQFTGV